MNSVKDWFNKLNANAKGIVLIVGGFVGTGGLALFIIIFTILLLIDTTSCSKVTDALAVLLIILALLFLTSVILVRIWAWKIYPSLAGRLAILGVHSTVMLASFIIISFGLLVIFNC